MSRTDLFASAKGRIEYAIAFASAGLRENEITPVTLANLRYELDNFLRYGPVFRGTGHFLCFPQDEASSWELDDFRSLQEEVKIVLRQGIKNRVLEEKSMQEKTGYLRAIPDSFSLSAQFSLGQYPNLPGRNFKIVQGKARDLFLLILFHLIAEEDTKRLYECPRPQCGKLFFRSKNQKYCSHSCTQKAINERYYKSHRRKLKGRSLKRYRDKVKKATGQNVTTREKGNRSAGKARIARGK